LIINLLAVPTAFASDAMPVAQQNALVKKYCAVCHTDAVRNGGLSLQHFDAAQAAPSLAAMLVSKLNSGAMGAAGIPAPDKATIDALINALASEATGAHEWNVHRTQDPATKAPMVTASILRELPSARGEVAALYRLVLSCNAATHDGEMQLAWAPAPKIGTLSATVDGKAPVIYKVEGAEKMGNGSQGTTGPAAISLYQSKKDSQTPRILLPTKTLLIKDLFPNESVEFPFGDLSQTARQSLAACFN
jgi:hypothetical protein